MSDVTRKATVPPDLAGERVDKAAAVLFDDFSRAVLATWISDGSLMVDGAQVKPKARLLGGEELALNAQLTAREDWHAAQSVDFQVVFEDEDVLVVNKPPGVVVHPGAGNPDATLVNGLLAHRPQLAELPRAGIVHRLDKDTSGLLLVAGSLTAHHRLVQDLQQRLVTRRYHALVEGVMIAGTDIDSPIGRDPRRRTKQRVRPDGRPAQTRVRVVERFRNHTLVGALLMTGRTHQIRVHLSSVGHPLVGDTRYGARGRLPAAPSKALVEVVRAFSRQALHAEHLAFNHPRTRQTCAFDASWPGDFVALVAALREDREAHEP
ncbi:MAG: 23S rRNA pseudouridine(1911/1915/1917) synthase RluD [Gammaproteobacteria bacterium]|nr:23S rRNA pseudouridine(1911/1915/1917) synthase RluD [Gammaproteobacteria bacterium]|tara:strand:+ start:427 stop:1389 length:963 start_codon:yes stop_codon:yes gene_type:complete